MTPREGLTDVHIGRTRRIGTLSLVSFLISASAPMTVLAGGIVATFAVTGVVGVPVAFPIIALALGLFTVGYAAMSRHIYNAGAFYSYLAQGLGKVWAVSGAGVALLSYNTANVFALPGVIEKTSKSDRFIISQQQLIRYTNPDWKRIGQLIDGRPR